MSGNNSEFHKSSSKEKFGSHIISVRGGGSCGLRAAILTMIVMAKAAEIRGDSSYIQQVANLLKEVFYSFDKDKLLQIEYAKIKIPEPELQRLFDIFIEDVINPICNIDHIFEKYSPYRDAQGNTENTEIDYMDDPNYITVKLFSLVSECLRSSIHDYAEKVSAKGDEVEVNDFNAPNKFVTMDNFAKKYFKEKGFHCISLQMVTAAGATEEFSGGIDYDFFEELNKSAFDNFSTEIKENNMSFALLNNGLGHIEGLIPEDIRRALTIEVSLDESTSMPTERMSSNSKTESKHDSRRSSDHKSFMRVALDAAASVLKVIAEYFKFFSNWVSGKYSSDSVSKKKPVNDNKTGSPDVTIKNDDSNDNLHPTTKYKRPLILKSLEMNPPQEKKPDSPNGSKYKNNKV